MAKIENHYSKKIRLGYLLDINSQLRNGLFWMKTIAVSPSRIMPVSLSDWPYIRMVSLSSCKEKIRTYFACLLVNWM